MAKHPEDIELQTLHALWLGLCQKVERGEVTAAQAIDIFEKARQTLVQQRQEKPLPEEKEARAHPKKEPDAENVQGCHNFCNYMVGHTGQDGERFEREQCLAQCFARE